MDEKNYLEEQELLQELAQDKVVELYTLQFLSHSGDPTEFFITHNLEDKVVQLDDVGQSYESLIIRLGWKAVDLQKEGKKKYARIARVFLPALRKIFYSGFAKRQAQLLMEEMMLQATVPFNDLENRYGGNDYAELDSYTGQPLDDITIDQERKDLGDRAAPLVPHVDDNLTARIVEVNPANIAQATNASRDHYDVSEEVWYEDREREDGPIQQNNDLMLRLNMGEVYSLIRTFRKLWNKKNRHGGRVIFWWLRNVAWEQYKPQNLLVVCHCFGISDVILADMPCPLPNAKNFLRLDRLFGHDILEEFIDLYDEVTDKEGAARNILTEDEILDIAKDFEEEILATFYGDNIPHTRVYASGVFNALATGEPDLTGAGYKNWRWHKSRQGSQAFDYSYCQAKLKGIDNSTAMKLAWKNFWGAGFIVKVHKDGLTVASEANGKSRKIGWKQTAREIATDLIRFTGCEKAKLFKILTDKGWGLDLLEKIGEYEPTGG